MSYAVWVRNDPASITEERGPEAVMWLVMENTCVYFTSDGRVGVSRGKHSLKSAQDFGKQWERLL